MDCLLVVFDFFSNVYAALSIGKVREGDVL